MECASGIAKIVEFQMADIIRKITIEKGFDPRDFVLFAFGGAGPAHAGVFARELGVSKVIVPQGETASMLVRVRRGDRRHPAHLRAGRHHGVAVRGGPRQRQPGTARRGGDGSSWQRTRSRRSGRYSRSRVDMRHKGQINEVEIALAADRVSEGFQAPLAERFYERYERLYGQGASFRGAPLEIVTFRLRASALTPRPQLKAAGVLTVDIDPAAKRPARAIYFADLAGMAATPIFDGAHLRPGNRIAGPAVIETTATTVVVHPGRTLSVDAFGNFQITFS